MHVSERLRNVSQFTMGKPRLAQLNADAPKFLTISEIVASWAASSGTSGMSMQPCGVDSQTS